MKIVADINQPLVDEYFGGIAKVYKLPVEEITNKSLTELAVEGLICRSTIKINEKLLAGTKIKYVGTCTVGYDHVDCEYLKRERIKFASAQGCNAVSVSEYIASALVKLALHYNIDLTTKVLGIVGVGNVGREVLRVAKALGLKVLLNDPPREKAEGGEVFCTLEKLLAESDIVTMHVPLIADGEYKTLGMAGSGFFGKMKVGAVFINASRGKVASQQAITEALDGGILNEAIIDVYEDEPSVSREFVNKLFIATEHISGHSYDGKINGTKIIYHSFKEYFSLEEHTSKGESMRSDLREIVIPQGYDCLKAIEYAIDKCYNIVGDSEEFKSNPENFSVLRKNYSKRYEFSHYSVSGCSEEVMSVLYKLGFNEGGGE